MDEKKYNLPFEIGRIRDRNISKLRTKKLILNETIPKTRQDYYLKSISDCREFLINNSKALIEESLIAKSYYLLANKKLPRRNVFRIVETYYEYKNCDLCELITMIIIRLKEVVFFYKLEYALLLIDFFKYRSYQTEIIIRKDMLRSLKKIFTDDIKRTELIFNFLKVNTLQSINENNLSFEEIIHYFKKNKNQIMSLFPIKRLFIFGSFAEKMNHSKSDLDFIVIFDERVIGLESLLLKNKLTAYLISELNIYVDIVLFQYAIKNLDLQSLNKIITIY